MSSFPNLSGLSNLYHSATTAEFYVDVREVDADIWEWERVVTVWVLLDLTQSQTKYRFGYDANGQIVGFSDKGVVPFGERWSNKLEVKFVCRGDQVASVIIPFTAPSKSEAVKTWIEQIHFNRLQPPEGIKVEVLTPEQLSSREDFKRARAVEDAERKEREKQDELHKRELDAAVARARELKEQIYKLPLGEREKFRRWMRERNPSISDYELSVEELKEFDDNIDWFEPIYR